MVPMVVDEKMVSVFNFYCSGKIQEGMVYRNRLYRLANSLKQQDHQKAYTLGWKLGQPDDHAVITTSDNGYKIWVDLRSQAALEAVSG